MGDELKLYADPRSLFACRVKIALNIKDIKYEIVEEDINNKSPDLIKYNPVHKKVPVLVHNGNPISESLVIIEYIQDLWKGGIPILPHDPYEKAVVRFWAKFIDDKLVPATIKAFLSNGEEDAVTEACAQLQLLENELKIKGKKFFGGDNINLVDITADFLAYWVGALEEVTQIKLITEDKFPKITEWSHHFITCQVVKEILPPRKDLLAFFKKWAGRE